MSCPGIVLVAQADPKRDNQDTSWRLRRSHVSVTFANSIGSGVAPATSAHTPVMPSKPTSTASTTLANQLRCHDVKKLLPALRGVKNQIIGNRAKKAAYTRFGVLASVLEVFSKHEDPQVLLEAAVALGSFAYNNPDGLSEILSLNGVQHFVRALSSSDERLVQANLRALKNIYKVRPLTRLAVGRS
jgi:hypothetical protein